jgi:hypothetical protein
MYVIEPWPKPKRRSWQTEEKKKGRPPVDHCIPRSHRVDPAHIVYLKFFEEREIENAHKIASNIRDSGGKADAVEVDVTDFPLISEIIEKLKPMEPSLFARKALNCVAKNKAIIVLHAVSINSWDWDMLTTPPCIK